MASKAAGSTRLNEAAGCRRTRVRTGRGASGGERRRVEWEDHLTVSPRDNDDIIAVDDALNDLARLDPRQAKIVELRFFGGMTNDEVASVLGVSRATIDRQWRAVKAWLREQLQDDE